jgi:DNA (cytosine-5)-methyltransferase 1
MNVLSLFSGVGGFDLGLENAGMKTIYQCEWDKHANSILERHWPTVPRWGDITTLTAKEILRHGTPPDVVAWGSPCQDLSVAGKRAGLEGERSGLFHEGIRIINELRKETNNEYPKISIWENVAGALSSNRGADFGVILDEMAKAGAMVIEWALLDAQHFGIPQRRRRVFVIAIFNPATASNCPSPLLPIGESLRGNPKAGKPKRKSAANTLTESFGAGGGIVNAIGASIYHKSTVVNQDVNCGHLVTEGGILGSDIVGSLNTSDAKMISTQYVNENKVVVEPYVKSRRAQSATDDETWVPGQVNPTLNSFDVGDTRATTAIIEEPVLFENSYRDGARIADDGVTQTLTGKMGTGGGNTPMIAYGIQGTMIGRQDHNGPGGTGVSKEDGPMFTLTKTDTHAVMQYDGYNQRLYQDDVALTVRIGRDSSDFIAQTTEPTMAVRRLTPLECERLMGWPDDHTRYKADGTEQADTHRYKQCGNGVASPVAEWIGKQLMNLETSLEG